MDWLTAIVGALTALGGLELIKWLANRKSNVRVAAAEAERAEIKSNIDEFALLREQITFLQQQMLDKEARFAEQTNLVRSLNAEVLVMKARLVELETERKMKLCEVRNCPNRQPQSGY